MKKPEQPDTKDTMTTSAARAANMSCALAVARVPHTRHFRVL